MGSSKVIFCNHVLHASMGYWNILDKIFKYHERRLKETYRLFDWCNIIQKKKDNTKKGKIVNVSVL